jgi:hypothetical protein|nr:MAG TPA: hypothetical protein [Bacteriophage sp.]
MSNNYFKIKKTKFPKCEDEVLFSDGLNIVTGDFYSRIHSHASYMMGLDENNEICIWSDSFAYSMHPYHLKMEAGHLIENVSNGFQAIVFTDSLFMMRQLDLLAHSNNMPIRYINLYLDKNELKVEQSDIINDINHLSILDENLDQADKYLRI